VTTMSRSSGRPAVRCQEPAASRLMSAAGSRGRSYGCLTQGLRDTDGCRAITAAGWADHLIDMLRSEVEEAASGPSSPRANWSSCWLGSCS
jgi:hypothetical protein